MNDQLPSDPVTNPPDTQMPGQPMATPAMSDNGMPLASDHTTDGLSAASTPPSSMPPAPVADPQDSLPTQSMASTPEAAESLEDQNIFYLLGVDDGTEEQKSQFLDELQQVIWEDFLDTDVKLLLTEAEMQELERLEATKPDAKMEEQEEVIVYLEKLIPDLEDILLEKALGLKADLFRERIAGMREYHAANPQALTTVSEAEQLMNQEKWLSAARLLNTIAE